MLTLEYWKALIENNIEINLIVGTSSGSIIGGLFAAGYDINSLASIVSVTNWKSFFSSREIERENLFINQKVTNDKALITLRLNRFKPIIPKAISSGQRIANFLNLLALNSPINNYKNYDECVNSLPCYCNKSFNWRSGSYKQRKFGKSY